MDVQPDTPKTPIVVKEVVPNKKRQRSSNSHSSISSVNSSRSSSKKQLAKNTSISKHDHDDYNNIDSTREDYHFGFKSMFGLNALYHGCIGLFSMSIEDRRRIALQILHSQLYLSLYLIIVILTIVLIIFNFVEHYGIFGEKEPIWFVILDVTCVLLMAFDVIVQIIANPHGYFHSLLNIFDFIIVLICFLSVPIYFLIPRSHIIFDIILLLRFCGQLLRLIIIMRHEKERQEYISNIKHGIVDFSSFNKNNNAIQQLDNYVTHTTANTVNNNNVNNNNKLDSLSLPTLDKDFRNFHKTSENDGSKIMELGSYHHHHHSGTDINNNNNNNNKNGNDGSRINSDSEIDVIEIKVGQTPIHETVSATPSEYTIKNDNDNNNDNNNNNNFDIMNAANSVWNRLENDIYDMYNNRNDINNNNNNMNNNNSSKSENDGSSNNNNNGENTHGNSVSLHKYDSDINGSGSNNYIYGSNNNTCHACNTYHGSDDACRISLSLSSSNSSS